MAAKREEDLAFTEWAGALLAASTVIRVQLRQPEAELVLTADGAREIAVRLMRLAQVTDGLDYATWARRRQTDQ